LRERFLPSRVALRACEWRQQANHRRGDSPFLIDSAPAHARRERYPQKIFWNGERRCSRALDANTHRRFMRETIDRCASSCIVDMQESCGLSTLLQLTKNAARCSHRCCDRARIATIIAASSLTSRA
jgi:hypothetical protein